DGRRKWNARQKGREGNVVTQAHPSLLEPNHAHVNTTCPPPSWNREYESRAGTAQSRGQQLLVRSLIGDIRGRRETVGARGQWFFEELVQRVQAVVCGRQ